MLEMLNRNIANYKALKAREVSERSVCESCSGAIEQFRKLCLSIRIHVSHAVIP
jgi:hypothetical protein